MVTLQRSMHSRKDGLPGSKYFVLKTEEAQTLGNTINLLDSSFKFSGVINIKAGITGYVSEVNHQKGDYVQEGEQLATISDLNSFVFILNLPYELRPYVLNKGPVQLYLPDGKIMMARVSSVMAVVDSASQTQNIVLKVNEKDLHRQPYCKGEGGKSCKSQYCVITETDCFIGRNANEVLGNEIN